MGIILGSGLTNLVEVLEDSKVSIFIPGAEVRRDSSHAHDQREGARQILRDRQDQGQEGCLLDRYVVLWQGECICTKDTRPLDSHSSLTSQRCWAVGS